MTHKQFDILNGKLDDLFFVLASQRRFERSIKMTLTELADKVTRIEATDQSAVVLIQQLAQMIRDNSGDPSAVQALADRLDASADGLAAAVTSGGSVIPPSTPPNP